MIKLILMIVLFIAATILIGIILVSALEVAMRFIEDEENKHKD